MKESLNNICERGGSQQRMHLQMALMVGVNVKESLSSFQNAESNGTGLNKVFKYNIWSSNTGPVYKCFNGRNRECL